jgi:hypothetical protein
MLAAQRDFLNCLVAKASIFLAQHAAVADSVARIWTA